MESAHPFAKLRADAAIRASPLAHHANLLIQSLMPSIRLRSTRLEQQEPMLLGASRIGGVPDLPIGWEWPAWDGYLDDEKYRAKKPIILAFIAQINLLELPV